MSSKGFLKIIKELNYPPIFLIPAQQFAMIDGVENRDENMVGGETFGIAATAYPVFAIRDDIGGKTLDNTIYHEIAHHLWPWRPHWWIDLFGEVMARGGGRGHWAMKYNKTPDDLPPREKLLKMARRQSEKLKSKYRIDR